MVATSKPEPFARRIIDHFALTPYFDYIAGMELDGGGGTKAEVILYAFEACKIQDKDKVLMVDDREYYVFGAREAGIDYLSDSIRLLLQPLRLLPSGTGQTAWSGILRLPVCHRHERTG